MTKQFDDSFIDRMIDVCDGMLNRSYCVYSKFPVGAALVSEGGQVYSGNAKARYRYD